MALPLISVIINTKNSALYLEQALKSVINQNYIETEMLIHDGASSDNTLDIIRNYETHIAYWDSFEDVSPLPDHLIKKSKGDLFILLGADDWYEPGIFQKVAKIFAAEQPDIITFGSRIVREEKGKWIESAHFCGEATLSLSLEHIFYGASSIGSRFFKRSFYEHVGPFRMLDENGHVNLSNDKEFLVRALRFKPKDFIVDEIALNYRSHPFSNSFSGRVENKIRLAEEHQIISRAYYFDSPDFYCKLETDMALRIMYYKISSGQFKNGLVSLYKAIANKPLKSIKGLLVLINSWVRYNI